MKRIIGQKALSGEDNSGMYWLTGSQKFHMMKNVSDSLAGRIAVFDMSSLSAAELDGRKPCHFHPSMEHLRERMQHCQPKNIHEIYQQIWKGGMPKLASVNLDRERYYMDYVNTYLERDIKDLISIITGTRTEEKWICCFQSTMRCIPSKSKKQKPPTALTRIFPC